MKKGKEGPGIERKKGSSSHVMKKKKKREGKRS